MAKAIAFGKDISNTVATAVEPMLPKTFALSSDSKLEVPAHPTAHQKAGEDSVMQVCLRVRPMLEDELKSDSQCLEIQS